MKHIGLVPLYNFAEVNRNLYRSAQPEHPFQFKWLSRELKIKTIINLRKESRIDNRLAPLFDIKVVNINVPDHHSPTLNQAKKFMELIKNKDDNPILFHCEHGHGRTSTFCVLARISEGWTLDQALKEEEKKFNYTFKYKEQKDFLIKHFGK